MSNEIDNWIINELNELGLPSIQYAVFGSGILDVLGIRPANDIDIIVTKEMFELLKQDDRWNLKIYEDGFEGLTYKDKGKNIEVFYQANMPFCDQDGIERMIRNATMIRGVAFVQLDDILRWKTATKRDKDLIDIKKIKEYQLKTLK